MKYSLSKILLSLAITGVLIIGITDTAYAHTSQKPSIEITAEDTVSNILRFNYDANTIDANSLKEHQVRVAYCIIVAPQTDCTLFPTKDVGVLIPNEGDVGSTPIWTVGNPLTYCSSNADCNDGFPPLTGSGNVNFDDVCAVGKVGIMETHGNPSAANTDSSVTALAFSTCEPTPDEDTDKDGIFDNVDNCPLVPNSDQKNSDINPLGDACQDTDSDGILDYYEVPGAGTINDNCDYTYNPNQKDTDSDGIGDVCDGDIDNDGVLNCYDTGESISCPVVLDNCTYVPNGPLDNPSGFPDQQDTNGDGVGDACDRNRKNNDSRGIPPTMGVNPLTNVKMVDNGFTCNGVTADAQSWYTAFPQVSINVGEPINCNFRVHDNYNGVNNLEHMGFALGKKLGESMSDQYGQVTLDIDQVTRQQTVTYDPAIFENVVFTASPDPVFCWNEEEPLCVDITLSITPRVPFTDEVVVGISLWNYQKSSWNYYFNHGITVNGEQIDDMPIIDTLNTKGKPVQVQLIDKTLKDKSTVMDINTGKIGKLYLNRFIEDTGSITPVSNSDRNREGTVFQSIKEGQASSALLQAQALYGKAYSKPFEEINNIFAYDFSNVERNRLAGTQLDHP